MGSMMEPTMNVRLLAVSLAVLATSACSTVIRSPMIDSDAAPTNTPQKRLLQQFQSAVGKVASYTGACKVSVRAMPSPNDGEAITDLECIGDPRYDGQIVEAVRSVELVNIPNWRTIVASPGWKGVLGWDKVIGRRMRVVVRSEPPILPPAEDRDMVVLSKADYQALKAASQIPLHAEVAAEQVSLLNRIGQVFSPTQPDTIIDSIPAAPPPVEEQPQPPKFGPIEPVSMEIQPALDSAQVVITAELAPLPSPKLDPVYLPARLEPIAAPEVPRVVALNATMLDLPAAPVPDPVPAVAAVAVVAPPPPAQTPSPAAAPAPAVAEVADAAPAAVDVRPAPTAAAPAPKAAPLRMPAIFPTASRAPTTPAGLPPELTGLATSIESVFIDSIRSLSKQ